MDLIKIITHRFQPGLAHAHTQAEAAAEKMRAKKQCTCSSSRPLAMPMTIRSRSRRGWPSKHPAEREAPDGGHPDGEEKMARTLTGEEQDVGEGDHQHPAARRVGGKRWVRMEMPAPSAGRRKRVAIETPAQNRCRPNPASKKAEQKQCAEKGGFPKRCRRIHPEPETEEQKVAPADGWRKRWWRTRR